MLSQPWSQNNSEQPSWVEYTWLWHAKQKNLIESSSLIKENAWKNLSLIIVQINQLNKGAQKLTSMS